MLDAVRRCLRADSEQRLVDATFGGGGYSRALLDAGAGGVIGIDRDPDAVARGHVLAAREPRFRMVEGRFGDLDRLVEGPVDGVVFDLGVSSFQLDQAERGFSFRFDGPLDMRMGADGPSAADLVADLDEAELADLFFRFGEEPKARRAARAIVQRRQQRPFTRTLDLADVVRQAVAGGRRGDAKIDPATRVFQALRIAVNEELEELERGLAAAVRILRPGGRLVVVAFHSLEDRIVKRFMAEAAGRVAGPSRHLPPAAAASAPTLALLARKPVTPDAAECAANPRARSARLRAAERLEA
ncbi:MAG: 16S rRNA (cytosine(1402)-N(4))-methyltransferase RsmH [Geminicoccaceae bacterium]|nr:MAG: 16S rRNA (cytosine(1402)-N(4))-methyltransferase RsmH [Geminicoccaceae bacterium]